VSHAARIVGASDASAVGTSDALALLAQQLAAQAWGVVGSFIPQERIAALRDEMETLESEGRFERAGVGRGARERQEVRGDLILWLGDGDAPQAEHLLQHELEALRSAINAATYLGLYEFEGHYAAYPAGAGYARHLDRFQDGGERVVSLVLYLNDGWSAEDGGELCLYPGATEDVDRIQPQGGTLVCFLSEQIPHEVLPARRTRRSLTGWYKRRA
jgi:SM-20-related protein